MYVVHVRDILNAKNSFGKKKTREDEKWGGKPPLYFYYILISAIIRI
jgi:hypothetical protein